VGQVVRSVDEVSFGSERETRLPARGRRGLAALAAVVAAGAVAAGGVLAVTTAGAHSSPRTSRAVGAPTAAPVAQAGCPPFEPARPNLAALPAGMRPGALKVVIEAEFSGLCPASR
jgi:hypothetical protein